MGIGAKVKIFKAGTSTLIGFSEISPAYGFSSSQPAVAHFGLGSEVNVDVTVEMPFGGAVFTRDAVPANILLVMPSGQASPPPAPAPSPTPPPRPSEFSR